MNKKSCFSICSTHVCGWVWNVNKNNLLILSWTQFTSLSKMIQSPVISQPLFNLSDSCIVFVPFKKLWTWPWKSRKVGSIDIFVYNNLRLLPRQMIIWKHSATKNKKHLGYLALFGSTFAYLNRQMDRHVKTCNRASYLMDIKYPKKIRTGIS